MKSINSHCLLGLLLLAGSSQAFPAASYAGSESTLTSAGITASYSEPTPSTTLEQPATTLEEPSATVGKASETAGSESPAATHPASNACASIRSLQAKYTLAHPSSIYTAPAALATNCLDSVPVNKKLTAEHIKQLKKYLQFHSTLDTLKDLPEGVATSQHPHNYDLAGLLDQISDEVENGKGDKLSSHWQVELAIAIAFAFPHDGHLASIGNMLQSIQFTRPIGLISLSEDGRKLPELYTFTKTLINGTVPRALLTPDDHPVEYINGIEASKYLQWYTETSGYQGPDARYNDAFASVVGTDADLGRFMSLSQAGFRITGDNFNITYKNGIAKSYDYSARILEDFSNIESGTDVFKVFADASYRPTKKSEEDEESEESKLKKRNIETRGTSDEGLLMEPVVQDKGSTFKGYFIPNTSTAVLDLSSFHPNALTGGNTTETIARYREFINKCRKAKMTNLIIDSSNNGGGNIVLGYDLFTQLFPDTKGRNPYIAQRFRISETHKLIAKSNIVQGIREDYVTSLSDSADKGDEAADQKFGEIFNLTRTGLVWTAFINPETGKGFASFEEFLRPAKLNGVEFSNSFGQNWTQGLLSGEGFPHLSEYDPDYIRDDLVQPFKEENIVFITDGRCSSTCSNFAEYLRQRGGIRTVALGGRPELKPMAHVGGVRGGSAYDFERVKGIADAFNSFAYPKSAAEKQEREKILVGDLPFKTTGGVNFLDVYRKDHDIPMQFEEDFADCRLFYTRETWGSFEKLWRMVGSLAFQKGAGKYNGKEGCAVGTLYKS